MTKKWVVGVIGAFALVAMTGVGFSAFTASATVYGTASAATMGLEITWTGASTCTYLPGTPLGGQVAPGNVSFSPVAEGGTVVSFSASNMTPGVYCQGDLQLTNTGSVPVNVSVVLSTAGSNGICGAYGVNCYDVISYSGIEASGEWWFYGSPTAPGPADVSTNFTTLNPGNSTVDAIAVLISTGFTSVDPSAFFTLTYTASAGF